MDSMWKKGLFEGREGPIYEICSLATTEKSGHIWKLFP